MTEEWFKNVTFEAAGFNAQENVNLEKIEVSFLHDQSFSLWDRTEEEIRNLKNT